MKVINVVCKKTAKIILSAHTSVKINRVEKKPKRWVADVRI